ncbi:hypothetical protein [Streptomyces sp. P9-A2]|uniref:hypothetical protein n=1 Tax=Streptomyces sp. P9-A2 TaxID=3072284 RepID=UPI002FC8A463
MTSHPTGTDGSAASGHVRLPVYEGLVRELGDVLAETREVAERMERQMRQVLPVRPHTRPAPAPVPR